MNKKPDWNSLPGVQVARALGCNAPEMTKTNEASAPALAAHTPGPWNVEHPYCEPGVYVAGPNTGLIAKLYTPDENMFSGNRRVMIEANAQLIASAPDMLAALRAAKTALDVAFEYDGDVFRCHHNDATDALSAIESAIAKATARNC